MLLFHLLHFFIFATHSTCQLEKPKFTFPLAGQTLPNCIRRLQVFADMQLEGFSSSLSPLHGLSHVSIRAPSWGIRHLLHHRGRGRSASNFPCLEFLQEVGLKRFILALAWPLYRPGSRGSVLSRREQGWRWLKTPQSKSWKIQSKRIEVERCRITINLLSSLVLVNPGPYGEHQLLTKPWRDKRTYFAARHELISSLRASSAALAVSMESASFCLISN